MVFLDMECPFVVWNRGPGIRRQRGGIFVSGDRRFRPPLVQSPCPGFTSRSSIASLGSRIIWATTS